MGPRALAALALALCFWIVPARALAWQEAHLLGDDVQVHVDRDGTASVEHAIRWHVVRGPLKSIDVSNVDPAAVLDPDVSIAAEGGRTLAGHLARVEGGAARVTPDDPRALQRGTFVFEVRWRVDLLAAGVAVRDGATIRLTLREPTAADGFDGARTVVDVPAAPDPPQPVFADTGLVDDGALSTLRREADRDVLELVRPHVSHGESPVWTLRLDARALAAPQAAAGGPASRRRAPAEPSRLRGVALALFLGALASSFGLLLLHKAGVVRALCERAGARPRALLPMPPRTRAALGGGLLALAAAVQLDRPGAGGVLVAIAVLVAAWRTPVVPATARGPGRWLVLRPDDAFASSLGAPPASASPNDWLDVGGRRGRIAAGLAVAVVCALAAVSRRLAAEGPWWVVLDSAVLVPLFATGRAGQIGAGRSRAARWLFRAYRRLLVLSRLRVAPWGRVTLDGSIDELRLLVLPRSPMPGVVGVEIGLAWSSTSIGAAVSPEILVRVLEPSPASARLAAWTPKPRTVPGRRPDERVARLLPAAPTPRSTVALARALVSELSDRRLSGADWSGQERRAPPSLRAAEVASAASAGLC